MLHLFMSYLNDRYANLLRPGMQLEDAPSSDEEEELAQKTQEYAAFLKYVIF